MPLDCAELEISLHPQWDQSCRVDLRFAQPGSDADVRLLDAPATIWIDVSQLRQLQLDPDEYGRALTRFLFPEGPDGAVRTAFLRARTAAESQHAPLRIRLFIATDTSSPGLTLHGLLWETLRDPERDTPLLTDEHVRFSRYLTSDDWTPVQTRPRGNLRALVAVANPSDLPTYGLVPVDVPGELARARASLGSSIPIVELAGPQRPTLDTLVDRLRVDPIDFVYLVAHGVLVKGEPTLWLEDDQGTSQRVSGRLLAERLGQLTRQPRLVVLASCQSAGQGASGDSGALTATGPLLAAAGVPAVVAMHGTVNMETVARFMPIFFRELERHGQIDWAMATARSQVRSQPDWWAPVLFMRLRSGRLWIDEIGLAGGTSPTPAQPAVPSPVAIQLLPSQRRHLETRKSEIEASYATLSRRMVALDTDFSRELEL